MAYTEPTTRATNDVITQSIWNTDLVDNIKALAEGVIPTFGADRRIAWLLPLYPVSATVTYDLTTGYVSSASITAAAYDATDKWVYLGYSTSAASGYAGIAGIVGRCAVQLLPEFRCAVAHVSLVTNSHRYGLFSATPAGTDPANGIYFRSTNGGNWFAVVRNASSETATDTGVAASTSPKELKIVVESTTSVKFYIAGTLVRTETGGNIPAAGTLLIPFMEFAHSANSMAARWAQYMFVSHELKSS